jgi:myo-inositol catabolism protein IolS
LEQRHCGKSDMKLSVIGAGCWAFGGGEYWGKQDQKDVEAVVLRSLELGINYFDTAETYNDGRSEESLGKALKGLSRDMVFIGTKILPSNCYPENLIEHCEASLKRLDTDYIDLYMVHWPIHPHSICCFTKDENVIKNPPTAREAFETLEKLQQQGKIRHIGVSNFAVSRLKPLEALAPSIVANELPYSLLTRAIEYEVLPYCRTHGIGVIGYMTLMQGVLADIYPTLATIPDWQRRTRHFNSKSCLLSRHGGDGAEEATTEALAAIRRIARQAGITMPDLAVKWALAQQGITCALVGSRTVRELEANLEAAAQPLDGNLLAALNKATEPLKKTMGPSFDYYESVENDRTR